MPLKEMPSSVQSSMADAKEFVVGVGYAKEVRGKNFNCVPGPPPPSCFCPPKCVPPKQDIRIEK